jgi:hypothetical protein
MKYAHAIQEEQANRHRTPAPRYFHGDEVWLLRKNIKTTRPCSKLDFKKLGKFKIKRSVGTHAYELQLPRSMRVHPVFHVSLLEPAAVDRLEGQLQEEEYPVGTEKEKMTVEEIVDARILRDQLRFRVKWIGSTRPDTTWYRATTFERNPEIIVDFYRKYPEKPKDAFVETLERQQNEEIYDSITVRPTMALGATASQELRQ